MIHCCGGCKIPSFGDPHHRISTCLESRRLSRPVGRHGGRWCTEGWVGWFRVCIDSSWYVPDNSRMLKTAVNCITAMILLCTSFVTWERFFLWCPNVLSLLSGTGELLNTSHFAMRFILSIPLGHHFNFSPPSPIFTQQSYNVPFSQSHNCSMAFHQ